MANNNKRSFEKEEDRGNYARELRDYFQKYGINLQEWWPSASPKTSEILIHYREGLENEREISRISLQSNGEGKISFGLSGYNYKTGEEIRNQCSYRGYGYNVHMQKMVKVEPKEETYPNGKTRIKPGRWWLTKPMNNLEEVAKEFNEIKHLLR
ncbi:MAG: hypothetical protein ACP5NZ_00480 [Nanobdellota archaeon]